MYFDMFSTPGIFLAASQIFRDSNPMIIGDKITKRLDWGLAAYSAIWEKNLFLTEIEMKSWQNFFYHRQFFRPRQKYRVEESKKLFCST